MELYRVNENRRDLTCPHKFYSDSQTEGKHDNGVFYSGLTSYACFHLKLSLMVQGFSLGCVTGYDSVHCKNNCGMDLHVLRAEPSTQLYLAIDYDYKFAFIVKVG